MKNKTLNFENKVKIILNNKLKKDFKLIVDFFFEVFF
jgi:hypothetical protein